MTLSPFFVEKWELSQLKFRKNGRSFFDIVLEIHLFIFFEHTNKHNYFLVAACRSNGANERDEELIKIL